MKKEIIQKLLESNDYDGAVPEKYIEAFAAGMNSHLSKPIEMTKLLETLSEILG